MAGGAGQEGRTRLGYFRRTAGAVEREGRGFPRREIAAQLDQRARAAARRRPTRGAVAEAPDDARDPLAVEVLAGDDDDAAIFPEEGCRQDPAVPEGEDGRLAGGDDGLVVLEAVDAPAIRRTKQANEGRRRCRNQRSVAKLPGRQSQLSSQTTKLPDSLMPRFPDSQIPRFPDSQIPRYPAFQIRYIP